MLHSHNYFRWRGAERDGADREGAGEGNEALFINLLCKQHHIGRSDGTRSVVEGGGTGKGGDGRQIVEQDESAVLLIMTGFSSSSC